MRTALSALSCWHVARHGSYGSYGTMPLPQARSERAGRRGLAWPGLLCVNLVELRQAFQDDLRAAVQQQACSAHMQMRSRRRGMGLPCTLSSGFAGCMDEPAQSPRHVAACWRAEAHARVVCMCATSVPECMHPALPSCCPCTRMHTRPGVSCICFHQ